MRIKPAAAVAAVVANARVGSDFYMKVLGIDVGGSAVKGAPVDTRTGRLLGERFRIATPKKISPARLAEIVAEIAAHFCWKGPVGIGFPGVIEDGRPATSTNLDKDFIGCDLARLIRAKTRSRVTVVNDADAAGLAEVHFGAGKKLRGTMVLLTLGTGVGSALFHDGELYPNTEFGLLPWKGRPAERHVAASVKESKKLSWKKWGHRLGDYLHVVETLVQPRLIVLGGGISSEHEKFFRHLKNRVRTVPAEMRNEAGIVGAALWAARAGR